MKLPFPLPRPYLYKTLTQTRPIISSLPTQTRPVSPQTPLFLRPATHSATAAELRRFQHWAHTLSAPLGPSVINPREVQWLLEDCFENHDLVLESVKDDDLVRVRSEVGSLYEMWRQRVEQRRPFQYVVGCEHWRDLVLSVEEGVLIPRPETELVVDLVSDLVKGNEGFFGEGIWADLGTGSGALAIGIGKGLAGPGRVFATDLSPVAVAVANYNIQRYNLQEKIQVRMGSWFEPLKDFEGELVGLVSNPPYIPTSDIPDLQAEVSKHEPILALDGGVDGLDDLLLLCHGASSFLKPGGFFCFETNGEKQCEFLLHYLQEKFEGSFFDMKIVSDFSGKQRFVNGYRLRR